MYYPRSRSFFDPPTLAEILLSILPSIAPVIWSRRHLFRRSRSEPELDVHLSGSNTQHIITTSIANKTKIDIPFVLWHEIRDSDGVTVHSITNSGELGADSKARLNYKWQPESPGIYVIRSFALSSLNEPVVLSNFCACKIVAHA